MLGQCCRFVDKDLHIVIASTYSVNLVPVFSAQPVINNGLVYGLHTFIFCVKIVCYVRTIFCFSIIHKFNLTGNETKLGNKVAPVVTRRGVDRLYSEITGISSKCQKPLAAVESSGCQGHRNNSKCSQCARYKCLSCYSKWVSPMRRPPVKNPQVLKLRQW